MKKEEILNQQIKENSKIIEDIVYDITRQYTKPLDDIMVICRQIFTSNDKITNDEIETMPGKRCAYDPDIAKIVKETLIKSAINPHAVNPNYLKLTEAEESKLNDNHN